MENIILGRTSLRIKYKVVRYGVSIDMDDAEFEELLEATSIQEEPKLAVNETNGYLDGGDQKVTPIDYSLKKSSQNSLSPGEQRNDLKVKFEKKVTLKVCLVV